MFISRGSVRFLAAALAVIGLSASTHAQENTLNPNHFYLVGGQLVGPRVMQIGDPSDWSVGVQNREGKSKSGKISVAPDNFNATGDAITLTWSRKKGQGSFAIYGQPIDLSAYKDAAALVIDMKVNTRPNQGVNIGMDCGYPCRATIQARTMLREFPVGQWFSLPIPLNCLKSDNFDLSKINGPFIINTEGQLNLSIANVRLEKLQEGETGCSD